MCTEPEEQPEYSLFTFFLSIFICFSDKLPFPLIIKARKEGLSLLLVAADEVEPYKKICKILGKENGIAEFPIENSFLPAIRKRAKLAAKIDREEHLIKKENSNTGWFLKNAEAMDIELDDDIVDKKGSPQEIASLQK